MLYQTDVAGKKSPDGMGNNRSVSLFVLASRRRVAVMVEGRGKGEVPQPWHDALLKIGNALIMMFCGGSEHVNSTSHHLCLGSGAWDLGPRWRSFPWESQRTVAMHPTSSR